MFCFQARVDKDLLIYEAFPFQSSDSNPSENRLKVRFKKYDHGLILNETWGQVPNKGEQTEVNEVEGPALDSTQWLRTFNNVSGYSGVSVMTITMLIVDVLFVCRMSILQQKKYPVMSGDGRNSLLIFSGTERLSI